MSSDITIMEKVTPRGLFRVEIHLPDMEQYPPDEVLALVEMLRHTAKIIEAEFKDMLSVVRPLGSV